MTVPVMAAAGAMSDAALAKEVEQLRMLLAAQADQLKTLNRRLAEAHPDTMTPQLAQTLGKLLARIGAIHTGFAPSGGTPLTPGSSPQVKSLGIGIAANGGQGRLDTNDGAGHGFRWFWSAAMLVMDAAGGFTFNQAIAALTYRGSLVQPAYGVNVTPDANANDNVVTANNGVAFNVLAPANPPSAAVVQEFNLTIKNTSGGALGVATFAAAYKMTAWVQPATGFNRTITFRSTDGGVTWVEIGRTAADVPN